MNQDQIKETLLKLEPNCADFKVILSGKKSKKVHGLYKPDSQEIIIHNKNFEDNNALLYTGIHEFAHHLHMTNNTLPVTMKRPHTGEFRAIFHTLLQRAEEMNIYKDPFQSDPDFIKLTQRIQGDFLMKNGTIMKEFGGALLQAMELCQEKGLFFEDYAERVLKINKREAKSLISVYTHNISPYVGYENMKMISRVPSDKERKEMEEALLSESSYSQVKSQLKAAHPPTPAEGESKLQELEKRKRRIEKSIESLSAQLSEVEKALLKRELQ